MKARLISLATIVLVSALSLQAQMGFGVKGGFNLQNITGKDEAGDKLDNGLKPGFHLGAVIDIPVAPDFYFEPGLLLNTKGTKYEIKYTKASSDYDASINLTYIELPLNLLYKPQLGNGHILLGFGPYLAYGVGGKIKSLDTDETVDVKFKSNVTASDDEGYAYFKGFDAGANIFFGYELPVGLFVTLNTQLGLLSMVPDYEGEKSDAVFKNTGFGISVGFKF